MNTPLLGLICILLPLVHSFDPGNLLKDQKIANLLKLLKHQGSYKMCPDIWPSPTHTDPEVYLNAEAIIRMYGYPCETHHVHTKDGYILTLFRIPHGKKNNSTYKTRPVMFLQHGLLDSAHTWIDNPGNESFAFLLADAGFDVWLGNSRGNTYSRSHETLSPKSNKFWDFTWDELAEFDIPACIDYVLQNTSQTKLYYTGHSQGTMIAFARLSEDPGLQSKIVHFFALGPVTNITHIESPIRLLAPFANVISDFFEVFGHGEFLPSSFILKMFARFACGDQLLSPVCSNIVFLMCGYDCKYTNETRLPVYLSHTPAGTSVKNILHYVQALKSKQFMKYDFGEEGNMQHYGQPTPPLYHVGNIQSTPISLYYGGIDWLADPTDVRMLIPQLKTLSDTGDNFITDYNHLDFVWGYNAKDFIYKKIIQDIKQGIK